jgi:hypothetical protein
MWALVLFALRTWHTAYGLVLSGAVLGRTWLQHMAGIVHRACGAVDRVTLCHFITAYVAVMLVAFKSVAVQLVCDIFVNKSTGTSKCDAFVILSTAEIIVCVSALLI